MGKAPDLIVFTDGSHRSDPDGNKYCGYGVVLLNVATRQYTSFSGQLGDHTAAFAETWAIYRGVQKAIECCPRNQKTDILVVTDSMLNVKCMSVYIPYVWDTSNWYNWKKADGKPVKNQKIYRRIVEIIRSRPEVHIRVAHVNSHLKHNKWRKIQEKLQKYNIRVDEATAKMFMDMNALCDELAQDVTAKMKQEAQESGPFIKLISKPDDTEEL